MQKTPKQNAGIRTNQNQSVHQSDITYIFNLIFIIRLFLVAHEQYRGNSAVTPQVCKYDLGVTEKNISCVSKMSHSVG